MPPFFILLIFGCSVTFLRLTSGRFSYFNFPHGLSANFATDEQQAVKLFLMSGL